MGDSSQTPTPRRRQEARAQGRVPVSRDVLLATSFAFSVAWLCSVGPNAWEQGLHFVRGQWQVVAMESPGAAQTAHLLRHVAWQATRLLLPWMCGVVSVALAAGLIQTGALWSPARLVPDPSRLSPVAGATRLVRWETAVQTLGRLLRLLPIVAVSAWFLWDHASVLMQVSYAEVPEAIRLLSRLGARFLLGLAMVVALIALLDYVSVRWRYERQLRMTPEELREEIRAVQNDVNVTRKRHNRYAPFQETDR